ncbi:MAG: EAL domain-containing protein, partial [Pseudomonadota bacterium]
HARDSSDIRLAVNFSVAQFYDEDLLSSIARVLQKYGLPASKLEVEVTESLFIRNPEHTKTILDDMRTMGLRVALDDFGTGYPALSYLKEFEVDTIKLDRSFISSIGSRDIDLRIVEGIVRLAKSLGLTVVSEGIETPEQDRLLRSIGCDVAQGYLYGKPMGMEQLKQSIEMLHTPVVLRPISAVV